MVIKGDSTAWRARDLRDVGAGIYRCENNEIRARAKITGAGARYDGYGMGRTGAEITGGGREIYVM